MIQIKNHKKGLFTLDQIKISPTYQYFLNVKQKCVKNILNMNSFVDLYFKIDML